MLIPDPKEYARVNAPTSYYIPSTEIGQEFDRLIQLIARICETPIATVTFVDANCQWFMSSVGLEGEQSDTEISFFQPPPDSTSLFVVEDALLTPQFADHLPACEGRAIRFYACMPLTASDGSMLGTMVVMDYMPRELTSLQIEAIETLARQVTTELRMMRQHRFLQDQVARSKNRAEALFHIANDVFRVGIWELSVPDLRLNWSDAMCELHEVPRGTHVGWHESLEFFEPKAREKLISALDACLHGEKAWDMELELTTARGRRIWVRSCSHVIPDNDGTIRYIHGTLQDLSVTKLSERAVSESEGRFRQLADAMPYIVWSAEPNGEIDYGNQAVVDYTGLHDIGNIAEEWLNFVHPADVPRTITQWMECVRTGEIFSCEYRFLRAADKSYRWHLAKGMPIRDAAGAIIKWYGTTMDIHDMKVAHEEIGRLAFYDPLTQLPNRQLLMDRLSHALSLHARNHRTGAVILIDLDKFKTINDTLGHSNGDVLLYQVAQRLASSVSDKDTVARLGGDEFVIVLEDLDTSDEIAAGRADHVARTVLSALSTAFDLRGQHRFITPSIGVALFGGAADSVGEVLKRADLAMYQAKAAGRNTLCFFDPKIHNAAIARAELESEMRQALHDRQFLLHYQPQVSSEGVVFGVEALVRWQHPQRGMVSPGEFIPLAEDTGLILPLGRWVLQTACEKLALLGREYPNLLICMSVNVSALQFRQPEFASEVLEALQQTGANPERLKIELTETSLVDDIDIVIEKISDLKEHGVCFSLDDFGTGYSSLSYLKRLPLDQLKIDQSFVRNLMTDPHDAAIVGTIITLGHTMGMSVIAEGVETLEQRDFLEERGCRFYQGYLFSKPLSADQLRDYLMDLSASCG